MTFTPGPWKTGHILNGDLWIGPDYDKTLVCRIEDERDERHANARLIASAPEMLEVLEEVEEFLDGRTDADLDGPNAEMRLYITVRAIIQKAKGETP
jgi:hypothetical protein